MSNRIRVNQADPAAFKAMMGLENYLATSGISKKHKELIKIRASQINGCAYCLNMHTIDARKLGETEQRIYTLSAWRDTPFFDEQEQAILALTEEMTLISNHGVSDETYKRAAELFDPAYLSQIIMAVVTINAWNRIAITTLMVPGE
ncbi:carboxymuconolactone decarboxylase family protein [Mucilaginibacter myungsuensis]|uniref:Carboxymuconolactone decarboxylase family protein n=1 Tax=Mucilaginibacter myungsuensis TaxID=649104 RepID=A0A929KZ36_9SPHI|nr:carboxymuconolactone decarboxylase family protein [Mucilaginibacter myungsuensis]MBE9664346.1 carboxymuconolactone decarboxylase family protein [Mucilaginibacter myungsuensis]MDN3597056.1 carboxymuconolactone decarboxylase family protein [Mucilaginibacter myungsuensis]